MGVLFTVGEVGGLEIPNRFVRSATYDAGADQGFVSDWQVGLYDGLSRSRVGLIITGVFSVRAGRASPATNSLLEDKYVPGLKRLADVVRSHGSRLAVQLSHTGREASHLLDMAEMEALGPSACKAGADPYFRGTCREMTEEEIWATIDAFAQGARRVREAGCDAVQIHGAHAYLVAQFLSPHSNRREDDWGGGLEGRLRLHQEIYRAIRRQVGPDYPVMIKLGVEDGFPGGLSFREGLEAAVKLSDLGYDAIEVSQGLRGVYYEQTEFRCNLARRERQAYFRRWAREVKSQVQVPVIMVGGLRRFDQMEEAVAAGEADFVSLCRPLIREPDLVASWEKRQARRPSCVSCNGCFEHALRGARLECVLDGNGKRKERKTG